jgi:predicted secreted protein
MTKPNTTSGSKLLVQVGDGASPTEVFSAPCGLKTKGISFAADTSSTIVEDCDDPDAAAWVERMVRSLSSTVTGSGLLALQALPIWRGFFFGGVAKNCRVKVDEPLARNGGHFAGGYVCTKFDVTGQVKEKVQVSIELQSDGVVSWVPASA